jgi:hypothetical protein
MKEDQNQLQKVASDDSYDHHSCKRQKVVSFDDNCTYVSIASCYDSDFDASNQQSPDCELQRVPSISCRANDHILLIFYSSLFPSSDSSCQICAIHPSFTHQLFPDEEISLPSSVDISKFSIFIFINEIDLSHSVYINGMNDVKVIESLKEGLQKGIPEDSIYLIEKPSFMDEVLENLTKTESKDAIMMSFPVSSLLSVIGSVNSSIEPSSHPPGKLLHSFDIPSQKTQQQQQETEENRKFEIFLSGNANPTALFILQRFEKIAIWFIETADSIDFTDHRWELLLLYEKQILPSSSSSPSTTLISSSTDSSLLSLPSRHSFVLTGYMTLFTFHNPFAGDSLRICQALILPKHQNLGFGKEMMFAMYQLIAAERKNVTQITVEDPCEGFQRLRNQVDFEWYIKQYELKEKMKEITSSLPSDSSSPSTKAVDAFIPWHQLDSSTSITFISEKLKIIKNQCYFVKEAYEYIQLIGSSLQEETNKQVLSEVFNKGNGKKALRSALHQLAMNHPKFPEFRLFVKKNLIFSNKELKSLPKVEMQHELVRLFDERLELYQSIIGVALRLTLITI